MQLNIDIPETLYRELEEDATQLDLSVQQLAALRLKANPAAFRVLPLKGERVVFPLLQATVPGTMDLTQNLNDAFFDEFHAA